MSQQVLLGWREWVSLPGLGISAIKAKIDSGARTSALHVYQLSVMTKTGGREFANFQLRPLRSRRDLIVNCEVPIIDRRLVRDSGGHTEERVVIETLLRLGRGIRKIELTLTSRDDMLFRLLIGRTALGEDYLIDSSKSYLTGRFVWSDMHLANAK